MELHQRRVTRMVSASLPQARMLLRTFASGVKHGSNCLAQHEAEASFTLPISKPSGLHIHAQK